MYLFIYFGSDWLRVVIKLINTHTQTGYRNKIVHLPPLNLPLTFQRLNGCHVMCLSEPGQLQRPGIERELSLGCDLT